MRADDVYTIKLDALRERREHWLPNENGQKS